jgi:exopolysaccharide production protein ExoZ
VTRVAIDRSTKGTVWNIQILRFVAAAMVLFAHLNSELGKFPAMAGEYIRFEPVWWPGGVDIFFVISGFIMYYISSSAFGRPGASADFVRRRLVRLVPPYWLFTTLNLLAMVLMPHFMNVRTVEPLQLIGSYLFIPALNVQGMPFPVLVLGWTLEFEMLFYAVFAIGLRFRHDVGLAVIVGLILAIAGANWIQPLPMPFGFWADTIVLEFLLGIGLAFAYRRGLRLKPWMALIVLAAGVAALLWVQAVEYPGSGWRYRFLWAGVPSLVVCAAFALVPESPKPGRFKQVLVLLGDSSYALYLSHPFTLGAVAWVVLRLGLTSAWLYIAFAAMACIAAAFGFHIFVEKPVYEFLTRWLKARRERSRAPKDAETAHFAVASGPARSADDA